MPIDRGIVDQQLQALGESSRWDQRELRDLPGVLERDEQILAISHGKIARPRWLRRSWLIVVTDRRLLCLCSSGRMSWRQLEVSTDQITRVSLRIGPFSGRVLVVAGGQTFRLRVPRLDAYNLVGALSSLGTSGNEAVLGFSPTRMVRRMVDHVLALPAAAFTPNVAGSTAPTPDALATEERVHSLQEEVLQLRQQVDFLEQLLRQRQSTLGAGEERRSS
jgi:hypothetical protein